jgi:hypothetical protein
VGVEVVIEASRLALMFSFPLTRSPLGGFALFTAPISLRAK